MKVFIKISFLVFVLLAATIIFSTSSTAYAATFVQDSFTGTGGTLLENHTGETGATWAKNPAALTGSMALTSTGALRDNMLPAHPHQQTTVSRQILLCRQFLVALHRTSVCKVEKIQRRKHFTGHCITIQVQNGNSIKE
jgi:hypothetical protein